MSLFDDAVEENSGLLMRWFIWMKALKSCMRSWQRELEGNRERYAAQIRELQKKVSRVTELSVTVQAQEARNKNSSELFCEGTCRNWTETENPKVLMTITRA